MSTDLGLDEAIQELSQQVSEGIAADDLATCLRKIVAFFDKGFGSNGNPFGSAARADIGTASDNVPALGAGGKLPDNVLDIGTAAQLDAGVDAGNVPVLGADGKLSGVVLSVGSAASLDAGVEAGNVPVLDKNGKLPDRVENRTPRLLYRAPRYTSLLYVRFGAKLYAEPRYTHFRLLEPFGNFTYLDFDFVTIAYRGYVEHIQLNTVRMSVAAIREAHSWKTGHTTPKTLERPLSYSANSNHGIIFRTFSLDHTSLQLCTTGQHHGEKISLYQISGIP